jgi:L-lactate dehydrogenase (cytochrome)
LTVIKDIKLGESGANSPPEIVTSLKRCVAPTPHRFRDLLALDDFERHAQRRLPPMIHL